jgi:hypothetical protein
MGGCFSLGWVEQLLVWLVIVCAIIAVLRLFGKPKRRQVSLCVAIQDNRE